MKRSVCVVFVLLLMLSFVSSLEVSYVEESLNQNVEDLEQTQETIEQFTYPEGRTYLIEEWKNIFLKNPAIMKMNSFFENFNVVFFFLLGRNYEFSFSLFFILVLWFFVFYNMFIILKDYSLFNKSISMGLSFGLATIFSHIQLYAKITNTLGGISFSNEFAFFREAVYFGILILLGFIIYVNGYIGKMLEEIKEEGEVAREKYNRKILGKIVNSLIGRIKDDTI